VPAAATPLAAYVESRLRAGVSHAVIRGELLAVGWSEAQADAAYRDGLVALGIPLPDAASRAIPEKKSATVDVVVNFFSFILLGIVATALGTLWFKVIELAFPDPLFRADASGISRVIHYAIASLVIAFPLYLLALKLWFRRFRDDPGVTESALSKWLTYLVLLIAAVTIVGDLIAVLFRLLQGEYSLRFLLKALVILVIAGLIFGFYALERLKIQYRRDIPLAVLRAFGWSAATLVVLGMFGGFFAAGSPETARKRALDAERETNLNELSRCIEEYAHDVGRLPASLDELGRSPRYVACAAATRDPETGRAYEYRIVTPSRVEGSATLADFELCATFSMASAESAEQWAVGKRYLIWSKHGAGRECDTVTVQLVGEPAAEAAAAPVP
jgi:hypothetical protein